MTPIHLGLDIKDYACATRSALLGHIGKMSAHAPEICDSGVNRLRMLNFNPPNSHLLPQYFFCWIRYVMEEVRRNLSWKRQPYLFWFGLIPAKRKQTMGILKMPPFCRVRLLTGDEHPHSFCRCVHSWDTAAKWVRILRRIYDSSVNRLRMLHFNRQIHTCYQIFFFCWIRYVMEKLRRNLSWKRQPYLFWFRLIRAQRKQTMGSLKMPPFCQVRLLTGDKHAHSFLEWFHGGTNSRTAFSRHHDEFSYRTVNPALVEWPEWTGMTCSLVRFCAGVK